MWYYSNNGERSGPVSEFAIQSLYAQRSIDTDTLVWQEGMDGWQALHTTRLAAFLKVPLPNGDTWETCAFSGDTMRRSSMVQLDGRWIGPEHKDEAVQLLQEVGELPMGTRESPFKGNTHLGHLMTSSWTLLLPCLQPAVLLYVLIWIPGNLVINYVDTFLVSDTQPFRSFQVSSWVQTLWGNLATGGILHLLCQQIYGRTETLGSAVNAALSHWVRLWVASFLTGIMTILGLLLFIVPGFIVIARTAFANVAAVDGKMAGSSAVQESWDVTKRHGWQIFGYMLLLGMLTVAPVMIFSAVGSLIPFVDHWAVNAVLGTVFELPMIYMMAFTLVYYREVKALQPKS